jgi:hypothetical protein
MGLFTRFLVPIAISVLLATHLGPLFAQSPVKLTSEVPKDEPTLVSYIGDWRISGPSPWTVRPGTRIALDGVLDQPLVAEELSLIREEVPRALAINWRSITSTSGIVSLQHLIKLAPYQGAFAVANVSSATEKDVALIANSDDGIRVWVNGQLATTKEEIPDPHLFRGTQPMKDEGAGEETSSSPSAIPPEKKYAKSRSWAR